MKHTISFEIREGADVQQEGTFWVPSGCISLSLTVGLEKVYRSLVFLVLIDPEGTIRLQKQLANGEPVIAIGQDGTDTTIGGVPGSIPEGEWTARICLFAEYLGKLQGHTATMNLMVTDEKAAITENIGAQLWTNGRLEYGQFDYDRVYRGNAQRSDVRTDAENSLQGGVLENENPAMHSDADKSVLCGGSGEPGRRWYKGDFHTHTRLSDGKETTANATRKAEQDGLDFYVPTEHNVVHTGWQATDLLILPGVEATTILGHTNLFGLTRRPAALDAILYHKGEAELAQDIEALILECRQNGWLFSVNHPFLHIWKWLYRDLKLADMDCLEINNDPTYAADQEGGAEEANRKAVRLSDLLWADGYRICAIGGSDSHNLRDEFYPGADEPSVPGDPATWVFMDSLTPRHLLAALKECRVYVTRHCGVTARFTADGREVRFGDELPEGTRRLACELRLQDCREEPVIFYLLDGERHVCESSKAEDGAYVVRTEISLQTKTGDADNRDNGKNVAEDGSPNTGAAARVYHWIRFGAETTDGGLMLYANPLTIGHRDEHVFRTFGEVRDYLEEHWTADRKGESADDQGNPV